MGARARLGTASLALLLVACGGGGDDAHPADGDEQIVNVYNWVDYIGQSTIADFEQRTGIRVHYDTYDSSEILETKMLTGRSGYDVVVPSATNLERQIRAGAYRELDKARLHNLANMDGAIMARLASHDPRNAHAIPYMWGTIGIGYNPDRVAQALGTRTIDSWGAVFNPANASRLAKCGIALIDAPEDVVGATLIWLGRDPNSERMDDLQAAESALRAVRPHVRYFSTSQYLEDLASGQICVALTWNGYVRQARVRGEKLDPPVEVAYANPREGSLIWFDTLAIPVDAPHPENAHAFIDFLMEPAVIAAVSNEIGFANGNAASTAHVDVAVRADPGVYPSDEVTHKLEPFRAHTQEYSRALNRMWTRIKTGQ